MSTSQDEQSRAVSKIVKPGDWEHIQESSFFVVVENVPDETFFVHLWREDHYFSSSGKCRSLLKMPLRLIGDRVAVAYFDAVEVTGRVVVGVSDEEGASKVALIGLQLGISSQTTLTRRVDGHHGHTARFPIDLVWSEVSAFPAYGSRYDLPVLDLSEVESVGVLPSSTLIVEFERETHEASNIMNIDWCVGVETNAFKLEWSKACWTSGIQYYAVFRDAHVYLKRGVVLSSEGIWSDSAVASHLDQAQLIGFPALFRANTKFGLLPDSRRSPRLVGPPRFLIANAGFGNFAHWVMNSLLAAFLARDQFERWGMRILTPKLPSFARESLELLGLMGYVDECDADLVRVDQVVYPAPLTTHANMYPAHHVIEFTRHMKAAAAKCSHFTDIDAPDYVYLTRKGFGSTRVIANEDDLIARLTEVGFACVAPHDLSFVEKVRVMSSARIVIAQLGASLTHIIFAPENATIFEITTDIYHSNEYWYMAKLLGQRYVRHMYEVDKSRMKDFTSFEFEVNIDALLSSVRQIMAGHRDG